MNVAFLLHLYQPSTQQDSTFKAIVQECYLPLFKLLKAKSACKFTLDMPLSLVEQLDKYGYTEILAQTKELLDAEKIELTGSAAYHPLLTKITAEFALRQIIFNEYGLGYYFGQRQGFEGEASMMIKDLKGFFPPEMAVNTNVLNVVDTLKYDWMAVDTCAIDNKFVKNSHSCVYKVVNTDIKLVVRDADLSNMISFKRDDNIDDIIAYLASLETNNIHDVVIALDGETFGHHNKYGIDILDSLTDALTAIGARILTVSDIVEQADCLDIPSILESTWSCTSSDNIYPLWLTPSNTIQPVFWDLLHQVEAEFASKKMPGTSDGYENIAIWKQTDLNKISDTKQRDFLNLELMVFKSMQSDQFWWASNVTLYDKVLYSPTMLAHALDIYKKIADFELMKSIKENILHLSADIERQI